MVGQGLEFPEFWGVCTCSSFTAWPLECSPALLPVMAASATLADVSRGDSVVGFRPGSLSFVHDSHPECLPASVPLSGSLRACSGGCGLVSLAVSQPCSRAEDVVHRTLLSPALQGEKPKLSHFLSHTSGKHCMGPCSHPGIAGVGDAQDLSMYPSPGAGPHRHSSDRQAKRGVAVLPVSSLPRKR